MLNIIGIIPARAWRNRESGLTCSVTGACPWHTDAERTNWEMVDHGWTWELSNGTVGLGRAPAGTREAAEMVMADFNSRAVK